MPTFGASAAAVAWPILKAAGGLTSVQLTTVTSSLNIETGAVTEITSAETVDGKVSPFRPDEVDGDRITARDRKVLIPVADLTAVPNLATRITLDAQVWHLQSPPERVSNDGLWQLHLRRIGDV